MLVRVKFTPVQQRLTLWYFGSALLSRTTAFLQDVLRFIRIEHIYEMMLGGDRPLNGKWTELYDLTITLQPFDIRTFLIDGIYK